MQSEVEHSRSEALGNAIASVLREHADHESDRGLLTSWVLIAEQIGEDGEPYLRLIHDTDSVQWRRLGMLDYAATIQRGVIQHDDD